jgi:hypothetical protein
VLLGLFTDSTTEFLLFDLMIPEKPLQELPRHSKPREQEQDLRQALQEQLLTQVRLAPYLIAL